MVAVRDFDILQFIFFQIWNMVGGWIDVWHIAVIVGCNFCRAIIDEAIESRTSVRESDVIRVGGAWSSP